MKSDQSRHEFLVYMYIHIYINIYGSISEIPPRTTLLLREDEIVMGRI